MTKIPNGTDHRETDTPEEGVRYPEVEVQLTGNDGNAYAVMGRVRQALRRHGVSKAIIDEYVAEATSGDYDNLLAVTMRWVTVE